MFSLFTIYQSCPYWDYSTGFSLYQNSQWAARLFAEKKYSRLLLAIGWWRCRLVLWSKCRACFLNLIGYNWECLMSFSWIAPPQSISLGGDGITQQSSWEMFRALLKWINKRVLLGHLEMSVPISQPANTLQIRLSSMTTDLPWTEMGWNTLANKHLAAHKYCVPVHECVCVVSVWFKTRVKSYVSLTRTLCIYIHLVKNNNKRLWNRPNEPFNLWNIPKTFGFFCI